jgi:hypothetical protein
MTTNMKKLEGEVQGGTKEERNSDKTIYFINCNWVVTRWQYTFTHKHYIEQHK